MFTCPKCGSADIHRTDNVQGVCGTILTGFFMLLFLGVLSGPPKWIAWVKNKLGKKHGAIGGRLVVASRGRRPPAFSPLWQAGRQYVLKRDNYRCRYCGKAVIDYPDGRYRHDLATIDHVRPLSKNGLTSFDNLVTACGECNSFLGNELDSVRAKRWYIRFTRGLRRIRQSA